MPHDRRRVHRMDSGHGVDRRNCSTTVARRDAALGFFRRWRVIGVVHGRPVAVLPRRHVRPSAAGEIQQSHADGAMHCCSARCRCLPVCSHDYVARVAALAAAAGDRFAAPPGIRELFQPQLRRITIVSSVMVASIYGIAFGVMLHLPRIVPGLEGIRDLPRMQQEQSVSFVHFVGDIGSFIGRFALAFLAISLLTRRQVCGHSSCRVLLIFPALFAATPYRRDGAGRRRVARQDGAERSAQFHRQLSAARLSGAPARHRRDSRSVSAGGSSARRLR